MSNEIELTRGQKIALKVWAKSRGVIYRYRNWQHINGYYTGFISVHDSVSKHEYGLILYDDYTVTLISSEQLKELESAC